MNNTANTLRNSTRSFSQFGSVFSTIFKIIIIIIGVYLLYTLYNYLFTTTRKGAVLLSDISSAKVTLPGYITILAKDFPRILQGGEYTVSIWIYINDWSYRSNHYKDILTIGSTGTGDNDFKSLAIYLGAQTNTLHVRVNTESETISASESETVTATDSRMSVPTFNTHMNQTVTSPNGPLEPPQICDVPSIELQRWILVTVALNNRTCDVYVDGKLARSCVLPGVYKITGSNNYEMRLGEYGGFGGYISNLSAYDYALNPEEVWKLYMAGPTGRVGFMTWLTSFFKPSDLETQFYPKMN
jgi:hypothetical protein